MNEAKEKIDFDREKENMKRKKLGRSLIDLGQHLCLKTRMIINIRPIAGSFSMRFKRIRITMSSESKAHREGDKTKSSC